MAKFRTLGERPTKIDEGFIGRVRFPTLMLLDERTPDGRLFESAGAGSRDLPLPISVLTKRSQGGHLDAEVAGRLDFVEVIMDDGKPRLAGEGQLLDTPEGRKMALLVKTRAMRSNSVDLEALRAKSRLVESGEDFAIETDFIEWNLIGTTGVPFPAFQEGEAELLDDVDISSLGFSGVATSDQALAYVDDWHSQLAEGIPEHDYQEKLVSLSLHVPSRSKRSVELFADPHLEAPTRVTVDGDRAFGHVAQWGVCHTSYSDCVLAPRSASQYGPAMFDTVETDKGSLAVGRLYTTPSTEGDPHPGLRMSWDEALEFYDTKTSQWCQARFGEDEHGIWFSGALIDEPDLRPLSGDWRKWGTLELCTALSVDKPGFPITQALEERGAIVALVGAGIVLDGAVAAVGCGCGSGSVCECDTAEDAQPESMLTLPDDVLAWARNRMRSDKAAEIRDLLGSMELDVAVNGSVAAQRVREALVSAGVPVAD
jgi:hypothetical protein